MDINDLSKDDLVVLISVIGDKLAKSIQAECISQVCIRNLEKEIMEDKDDDDCLDIAEEAEALAEEVVHLSEEIKTRDEVIVGLQERLAKTKEEWLASAEISRENEKRLELKLKTAREDVMNEVAGITQAAVEAEREDCAGIARQDALRAVYVAETNALLAVVNKIKERGAKR